MSACRLIVRVGVLLAAWSVAGIALAGSVTEASSLNVASAQAEPETASVEFWRKKRDGWFWYRTPPELKPQAKTAAPQPSGPIQAGESKKDRDIQEFEEFQVRLENLRKVAIINPTPENVRAYMVYERMAFKQSTLFAEMQQALNWIDPVFAEDQAELRPVNAVAMRVWDQQRSDSKREFMSRLAKTHGLYFFIRGDCPYCHAFAPLIKRFGQETGITIFPVSLDGGGNLDYPKPVYDNGIAARLGIKMVPALVLAQPSLREYQVVSFGVVSEEEIMDRIYALMNEKRVAASPRP